MELPPLRNVFAASLLLAAGAAQAAIKLPLPWQAGTSLRYQSVSTQEKTSAGRQQRIEAREVLGIRITEARKDGFLQEWRSESSSLEVTGDGDNLAVERATARKLAATLAPLGLQVELDAAGNYLGLRNWPELGKAMRAVLRPVLLKQAQARPGLEAAEAAELRALLDPALAKLTGKEALASTLGSQPAIFNFFTAPTLQPGKPLRYQDSMPSPWSAEVFPTVGSVELLAVNEKAGTVTLSWRQAIDPEKGAVPDQLRLTDTATVVLDRRSGVPRRIEHRREVVFGSSQAISTWTLSRIEP